MLHVFFLTINKIILFILWQKI